MNFFVGLNLVFIFSMLITMYVYYKGTPKFSSLELTYYISLTKKREKLTYIGYVTLTIYVIAQYVKVISEGTFNIESMTGLIFETLIYIIFINIIPRAYGVSAKGIYAYGIFKKMGKLYKWKDIDHVKISKTGDVTIRTVKDGTKKEIYGIIESDLTAELTKEIKSFRS